jgi:hypothetical protein
MVIASVSDQLPVEISLSLARGENYWRKENTGSNLAIGQSGFPVGPGLFPIGDS